MRSGDGARSVASMVVPNCAPSPNIRISPAKMHTTVASVSRGTYRKNAPTVPKNKAPEARPRKRIIMSFRRAGAAPVAHVVRPPLAGLLTSEIFDVSVGAEARVIREIPAVMIRVLIDHHLIATPIPFANDVVIVRGNVPVEIVEPEALPVASPEHKHVLRSEAAFEMPVRPGMIDLEVHVCAAAAMSHPLIVVGMHVRNFRMASLVCADPVLRRRVALLSSDWRRQVRRSGRPSGSWTASRNVPTTHRWRMTAAMLLLAVLWFAAALLFTATLPCGGSHAKQN